MRTARIKLILFALALLGVGGWLGAFAGERLATYRGGIAAEATCIQANEAFYAKDLARAELLAFKAIPLDPDSYLPYEELGDIYIQRNETAAAITAYSLALQKLTENKGHYRVVRHLDPSMRQQELVLLRDKIAKLRMRA
jgi:Tfp pilus assembly protein PilF